LQKILKSAGFYLLLVMLVVFLASSYLPRGEEPEPLGFDKFVAQTKKGQIESAEIKDRDKIITGKYKKGSEFEVNFPESYNVPKLLLDNEVPFTVDPQREIQWFSVLLGFLPFLLILALWIFMLQQMQGGGNKVMSFGKSKAKKMTKDQPRVTFKDVAGVDEAVEELHEIKEFLANPVKFQALGAKIPKGVLLYGPPGSGKTLLARAVAGEAGVPFFSISGSDFVEMFVGVGASRVRDLFEQAKTNSPCIIFMDEIDAVGRHRGAGLGGGHDEREQTLNQLLVEMDGFDIKDNIILVAATNRPDILDPALLRPGRFDRQIVVPPPDLKGREDIIAVHSKGKPLAEDVDLNVLARRTAGFTGADLANLVNEGALLAARHGKKFIDMGELEEATERVIAGPERKSRLISDKEKRLTAYHEAGHAVVAHMLPTITDPVHKVTIIPRGRAGGYTLILPAEDRMYRAKSELLDEVAMLLGGRVAEEIFIGDITTGAQNDLERATKLARRMVCEWGMSEKLGPLTLGQKQHEVFLGRDFNHNVDYSQEIAFEIDKEIRRIIDEAIAKNRAILTERSEQLEAIVAQLIEKETLEKDELIRFLDGDNGPDQPAVVEESEEGEPETKTARKPKLGDLPGKLRPAES
jgi:cell division protease FtsH